MTHSQQRQPVPTTQSCNIDEYKKHEWEIKLSIAKSCAEMAAKGNVSRFLEIMNSFLKDIGLSPLNIVLKGEFTQPRNFFLDFLVHYFLARMMIRKHNYNHI